MILEQHSVRTFGDIGGTSGGLLEEIYGFFLEKTSQKSLGKFSEEVLQEFSKKRLREQHG